MKRLWILLLSLSGLFFSLQASAYICEFNGAPSSYLVKSTEKLNISNIDFTTTTFTIHYTQQGQSYSSSCVAAADACGNTCEVPAGGDAGSYYVTLSSNGIVCDGAAGLREDELQGGLIRFISV